MSEGHNYCVAEVITASRFGEIKDSAATLGFSAVAALPVSAPQSEYVAFHQAFVLQRRHADLKYLERAERFDVRSVYAAAETILLFTFPYRFAAVETKLRAAPYKIARYAWQRDYHKTLKDKLQQLAGECALTGRAVTDSAPLAERYWARRAGLGSIGRNGMLIAPGRGSFFLIAALLVENPLAPGIAAVNSIEPAEDIQATCGECRLCVDACPTSALTGDGTMEIAQCISYTTIESRAETAYAADAKRHRWIFGCDICQQVCPHNKTPASYAPDDLNDEHAAAQSLAAGEIPQTREDLADSVFLRRGVSKLGENIAAAT